MSSGNGLKSWEKDENDEGYIPHASECWNDIKGENMIDQNTNDKLLVSLVENIMDVTAYRKKKLTDTDRKVLLEAAQTIKHKAEMPIREMKCAILKKLGYSGDPSSNVYLSRDETKYIYNTVVLSFKKD